jgi:8-oxo-dGTP pyrophosphatase MutT (NUDIX family)
MAVLVVDEDCAMKSKQYAALPFRRHQNRLQVLLISTRTKQRWSVPKGWPIERQAPHGTAAIEAFEEAGLTGKIAAVEVGRFKHRKQKNKQSVKFDVRIFPLRVVAEKANWPEKGQRRRLWLSPKAAARLAYKNGLKRAIANLDRDRTGK